MKNHKNNSLNPALTHSYEPDFLTRSKTKKNNKYTALVYDHKLSQVNKKKTKNTVALRAFPRVTLV